MSKKNLIVLSALLAIIPTSAFAATIQENVMTIPTHYVQIAFAFACLIGIRFLFEDWMQNRTIAKLNAEIKALKETAILNNEAHKETRQDARIAWEEVETLLAKVQRLNNRITALNEDVDGLSDEVMAHAAAFGKERVKFERDIQFLTDQTISLANLANNQAQAAHEEITRLQNEITRLQNENRIW